VINIKKTQLEVAIVVLKIKSVLGLTSDRLALSKENKKN